MHAGRDPGVRVPGACGPRSGAGRPGQPQDQRCGPRAAEARHAARWPGWPRGAPGGTNRHRIRIKLVLRGILGETGLDPADLRQAAVINQELYGFYGVSVWVTSAAYPRE